tara:strand:- start:23 stop:190 length:168 start_codon:yes stop_codon:yes gene_type:complete
MLVLEMVDTVVVQLALQNPHLPIVDLVLVVVAEVTHPLVLMVVPVSLLSHIRLDK